MIANDPDQACGIDYVAVTLDSQVFGLPVAQVQGVFVIDQLTRVPLSQPEIAGILHLRGRIVTIVDLRRLLGLPPRLEGAPPLAVGIEWRGEAYGLLVDAVGEFVTLGKGTLLANPVHLEPKLARPAAGVHRLEAQLMMILDVDQLFEPTAEASAA